MTYMLESTVADATRGAVVVVDAGRVRSIGGAEKNALASLKVPKFSVSSATEWSMLMASRTLTVDEV